MMIVEMKGGAAYAPALEELIEACENSPNVVYFAIAHDHAKDLWKADVGLRSAKIGHANGSTPQIAVARLWLALHANGDASA
jgi:hypothetical protein